MDKQFETMSLIREYARSIASKNPLETDALMALSYYDTVRRMMDLADQLDVGTPQPSVDIGYISKVRV